MEGVTGRRQTKSAAVVPPVRGPRGKPVESRRGPATVAGQPVPRSHSQACGEGGTARSARSLQTREPGNLPRSEEHTSELQSQSNLVCRLLLEKNKNTA